MIETEGGSESIRGFFVVLNPEEVETMNSSMLVNNGRSGVYYQKNELISTLSSRPLTKSELEKLWANMHIVEVETKKEHRTNENGVKFCIKGGKAIPIKKIEAFEDAKKELQMQA